MEAAVAAATVKITKRTVDAAHPRAARYIIWDSQVKGFGLRVEASGTKTYLFRYRPQRKGAPKRFVTIGRHGPFTADQARAAALGYSTAVEKGEDPAADKAAAGERPTFKALFDTFTRLHVIPKLKPVTAKMYRSTFDLYLLPKFGTKVAEELQRVDLVKVQAALAKKTATANRVLNYVAAMYEWAAENGLVAAGINPAKGIDRYEEVRRERFLSEVELDRLGEALRLAETVGIPWEVDSSKVKAKHAPKEDKRQTPISPNAGAAIRLLLLTGARMREILHLRWSWVDLERGAIFLPDSKTGRKTIYLNGPALAVLSGVRREGEFVFPAERKPTKSGKKASQQPRADLKRPWEGVRRMAGLDNLRLHDLRHTHASFGVGGGVSLPIISKILGHTQIRTTERYSHLDADPVRRASESIGKKIADALAEKPSGEVVDINKTKRKA